MAAKQSQEIQKQIAQHLKNINRYSHLVHQEPEESETDLLGEDDLPTNPIIIPPRNQMHREVMDKQDFIRIYLILAIKFKFS